MNKYHFNIAIDQKLQNAGTKANVDCKKIMEGNGYIDIEMSFVKSIFLLPFNLTRLCYKLLVFLRAIPAGSLIVTQYPLLGINRYFPYYAALLKKKKCMVACIIHDLDSLRGYYGVKVEQEMQALSAYDVVITHNAKMTAWLRKLDFQGLVVEIGLFDYLADFVPRPIDDQPKPASVIFAGNLTKCRFLKDFYKIKPIELKLYGPGFIQEWLSTENSSIHWAGSFAIDQIIYEISGKYGLIWDGDSIKQISGKSGNYLRYNAPHKLSLYLAAGIPVIISADAAAASLVKETKIGLTISSLKELPDAIAQVGLEEYENMRENAVKLGEELRHGRSFTKALQQVEKIWQAKK